MSHGGSPVWVEPSSKPPLENALDPSHTIRCDALVGTGAAYLTLPNAWRNRLGSLTELDTV